MHVLNNFMLYTIKFYILNDSLVFSNFDKRTVTDFYVHMDARWLQSVKCLLEAQVAQN